MAPPAPSPSEQPGRQPWWDGRVRRVLAALALLFLLFVAVVAVLYDPRADTKQRAYPTQMISDLVWLATAESTYFAESGRYTTSLGDLFSPTAGVDSPKIVVSRSGYSATVTHPRLPGRICGIAVGMPNPVGAAVDREPVCKGPK
jgi:hypothetical protein